MHPSRPFEPKNGFVKWFDRQLPLFRVIGEKIFHVGAPGNGAILSARIDARCAASGSSAKSNGRARR